jgi:hypothetical protein
MTTKRTPVRHRERLAYPPPWEAGPISRERWQKHRERLMAECAVGRRPEEWWLYEQGCEQPENQTQVLYTMGELRAEELAKLMVWWRDAYVDASETVTVGSFGTVRRTPEQRQAHLDFHEVPRELVAQWDAERAKGAA